MNRTINFNSGPSTMFPEVLQQAASEMLDYRGTGTSILEQSHRGKAYAEVHGQAIDRLQRLLAVPPTHQVLLLSGGASMQFAMLPMNFLPPERSADYVVTGYWGKKAIAEACTVGRARTAFDSEHEGRRPRVPRPEELELDPDAAYVHLTSNDTIAGVQFREFPDTGEVPLMVDMSSDILSRPIDVSRFTLIYAGAQKNMGPSGVTVAIVRRDAVAKARTDIPRILRYATHCAADSLYNTPPSFAVYLLGGVLEELEKRGGPAAMQRLSRLKADALYAVLDSRPDLYRCDVETGSRSVMNVVFRLEDAELQTRFLSEALANGFYGIRGHKSVGGVRVSLYNAVPREWVERLCEFMMAFKA